jgi:general L-amino acid transport system permease protein
MAAVTDPANLPATTVVNYEEPPVKPPPLLAVGPIAWMRKNLFASPLDAILTVAASAILIAVVTGFLSWAISQANWFAITRNLRLFMLGTFPIDAAWRVNLAALIVLFAVGFTLRAFGRITRPAAIALAALLIALMAAPPLIGALTVPAHTYLAAGETAIESGTVTERPIEAIGFIGRAGETIAVTLDPYLIDDASIAALSGFSDRATQALINAAANRLRTIDERAALERRLRGDLLTEAQRAALTEQLAGLTVGEPVAARYAVNREAVRVQLLDGGSPDLAVLANLELQPFDITLTYEEPPPLPTLTYTLPADGWYVLRKTDAGGGTAILTTTGIYPLLIRDLGGGRITYSRLIDDFETTAARPRIDDREVTALVLNDNQYRGSRSFNDYARLMLAPLFEGAGRALIPLALVGAAGYLAADGIDWQRGRRRRGRAAGAARGALLRWLVTPIWVVTLIFLFLLPYGIPNLTGLEVGLLLARFLWVGVMFFAGAAFRQPWGRPLLALVTLLGIALHAAAERLGSGLDAGRILGVIVWTGIGLYAARQGARQGGGLPIRALIGGILGSALLTLAALLLPALLIGGSSQNVLALIDTRRWGGFLLTMMLTVVAILASFPLGVLLALGRRSTLPAVKWACTIYIELVRGVPLITVLFMAQLLVPLANPALANVDNVIRAMVGLTLFSAAYLAENVRGGLQSIPYGQVEAARALGLSTAQTTLLILLPQALRAVIPALVGQCIALFKDTSLVALVGLTDLTGIARGVVAQTEFIGLQMEVYAFISVIYFVFSYLMAYISRRIEASGSGAARRI